MPNKRVGYYGSTTMSMKSRYAWSGLIFSLSNPNMPQSLNAAEDAAILERTS